MNLRLLLALSDADVGDLSGPWLKVVGTKFKVYGGYDIKNKLQALGFQWKKEEVVWVHHSVDSIMEDVGVGMPEDITISVCMEAAAAGERLAGAGTGALKQKAELNIISENVQAGVPYCTLNFKWNKEMMAAAKLDQVLPKGRWLCDFVTAQWKHFDAVNAATAYRGLLLIKTVRDDSHQPDAGPARHSEREAILAVLEEALLEQHVQAFGARDCSSTLHTIAKTPCR